MKSDAVATESIEEIIRVLEGNYNIKRAIGHGLLRVLLYHRFLLRHRTSGVCKTHVLRPTRGLKECCFACVAYSYSFIRTVPFPWS